MSDMIDAARLIFEALKHISEILDAREQKKKEIFEKYFEVMKEVRNILFAYNEILDEVSSIIPVYYGDDKKFFNFHGEVLDVSATIHSARARFAEAQKEGHMGRFVFKTQIGEWIRHEGDPAAQKFVLSVFLFLEYRDDYYEFNEDILNLKLKNLKKDGQFNGSRVFDTPSSAFLLKIKSIDDPAHLQSEILNFKDALKGRYVLVTQKFYDLMEAWRVEPRLL